MFGVGPDDGPALDEHVAADAHGRLDAHPHGRPVPEDDAAVVRRVREQLLLELHKMARQLRAGKVGLDIGGWQDGITQSLLSLLVIISQRQI